MLGPGFADGDNGRDLGEAVNVSDFPAEFTFHPLNRGGCGRRTGGENSDTALGFCAQ